MPSYRQMLETAERWQRMPGVEAVAGGVALTFDDGPDAEGTPAVLDALDEAGVKATFFLVGEQLMRNHAIAREAAARGHDLALHGFEHVEHDSLRPQAARDDLARAVGSFEAATGRKARFFRPPYGRFSEASYDACRHLGLEPVYWSAWGLDWEAIGGDRVADLATRDMADGDIVLLHDSTRYGHRPDSGPTAEAIAPIAARAGALGLRVGTLTELLP
jgi:peptidoglycan/xylan/chitin deacetylase (PgdA/CDA1 family)